MTRVAVGAAMALTALVVAGWAVSVPLGDADQRVQRDVGDPVLNVWALDWEWTALTGPGSVFEANIFWPEHDAIAYSEAMLPLVPVYGLARAVTGDPLAANAVLVVVLVAAAMGAAYALARRYVRVPACALVAAVGFGLGGYAVSHLAQVQLLTLGSFPLVLLAGVRALERPSPWRALWWGASIAVGALCSLYYGLALAVLVPVAVLVQVGLQGRWRDRRMWATVAGAAALAALLVGPALGPYLRVDERWNFQRPIVAEYELQPEDLLTPAPGAQRYDALADRYADRPAANEHALFPGVVVLVLGAVGLALLAWPRSVLHRSVDAGRRVELVALAAGAAAVTVVALGGEAAGVTMPFRFLHDHVPGFDGIRVTARFAAGGLAVGSVLAAVGLDAIVGARRADGRRRVDPRVATAVAASLAVVAMLEVRADVSWVRVDRGRAELAVYRTLDAAPPGPVVELPMGDPRLAPGVDAPTWPLAEPTRMLHSLVDRNPRVNGYSGNTPGNYLELIEALNGFPSPASLDVLDRLDVDYVVVHVGPAADGRTQYGPGEAARMAAAAPAGWAASRHGDAWLFSRVPTRAGSGPGPGDE